MWVMVMMLVVMLVMTMMLLVMVGWMVIGDVRPDLSTSTSTASHLEAFELPSKLNLDIFLKTKIFHQRFFSQ